MPVPLLMSASPKGTLCIALAMSALGQKQPLQDMLGKQKGRHPRFPDQAFFSQTKQVANYPATKGSSAGFLVRPTNPLG